MRRKRCDICSKFKEHLPELQKIFAFTAKRVINKRKANNDFLKVIARNCTEYEEKL